MHKITALVPMKGKSERVIGKNLRTFIDKPLCFYILETLQKCEAIEYIIVNTDSEEIATISQKFSKVIIHKRVSELQGHHIPMNAILEWDMEYDKNQATHYLQTHATNPLLTTQTIDKAIQCYFNNLGKYDSLFSVTPLQTRLYNAEGNGINHDPKILLNTQDLPKLYEENSNIYIFSRSSFNSSPSKRIGNKPFMFEMDKIEAFDIDNEEDFTLAQAAYKALRANI